MEGEVSLSLGKDLQPSIELGRHRLNGRICGHFSEAFCWSQTFAPRQHHAPTAVLIQYILNVTYSEIGLPFPLHLVLLLPSIYIVQATLTEPF